MSKFVMVDSHTLPGSDFHQERNLLEKNGIEVIIAQCKSVDEVIEVSQDADCIGVNYFNMDENIISKLENCKAIIRYGIGYDVIDIEAASKYGIIVCNLPDYCVDEVANHAMALILDICRKTTLYDRNVRSGNWDVGYGYDVHRLSALTLGLIGFGNTARRLSQFANGFDMKVIASDPFVSEDIFKKFNVKKVLIDDIYKESDIISIHAPLVKETKHMICEETIRKMKDGVMIVNTSRGPIVHTNDLLSALESGKIRAAGLDVVESEPIRDANSPLYRHENLVITPHTAYNSIEASDNQHIQVAKTAFKILIGEMPQNIVNKKQLGLK